LSVGTFFGIRGLVRTIARILGFPPAVANVIAAFAATAFSESTKLAGRQAKEIAVEIDTPDVPLAVSSFRGYSGESEEFEFNVLTKPALRKSIQR